MANPAPVRALAALGCALLATAGCEKLFQKDSDRTIEAGDKKVAAGDYRVAIKMYEASLDGTPRTADVHFKLAMIYDGRLNDPLNALHHFNRYLDLAPEGPRAAEVKRSQKTTSLRLAENLGKDSLISQEQAVKIKQENYDLRMKVIELTTAKNAPVPVATPGVKGEAAQKPIPAGARTYVVQSKDTFASIARKFYKNPAKWTTIRNANFYDTKGTPILRPGQTLIIP